MKLDFGPGVLVAAAFIGPGTVTTAASAGTVHNNEATISQTSCFAITRARSLSLGVSHLSRHPQQVDCSLPRDI